MTKNNEDAIIKLTNPNVFPEKEVIKEELAESFKVFERITTAIVDDYGLTLEWNYYNDWHCWLCKVLKGKKNLCWLSVWDRFFKVTFYFTEKHLEAFAALDISEIIKENLCRVKPTGKHLPLIFSVTTTEQLPDILKVIMFKKCLK